MAKKESTQHKLDRVRAPRVQLTYDVEVGDAIEKKELPFVAGFVCLGMRSVAQPYDELAAHFAGSGVELMNIGDSNGVGKIIDATAQGRDVLLTLERIGVLDA